MGRTFLQQDTQISSSFNFNDALASGLTLQSGSYNLESDLNALRSQLRTFLYSTASGGKWYDDITATPIGGKRGINLLGEDLEDLERKRLIYRVQKNVVGLVVPNAQNFVTLSVGAGFAPTHVAAVTAQMTGTIVSVLTGDVGSHSMLLNSGSNILIPKNLVAIVTASTGNPIQAANGQDIYGLLQAESGTLDGDTFNDTTKQVQISFVVSNTTRTGLVSASIADIQNKSIQYGYARRVAFDEIPDDAYLDGNFVDMVTELSSSLSNIVTLDAAIDNQTGAATQTDRNIEIRMTSPFSWSFANSTGTRRFLEVNASGQYVKFDVNNFDVLNTSTAQFLNSLRTNVSGNWVELSAGNVIASGSLSLGAGTGSNLILSGGGGVTMTDQWKPSSTYTNTFYFASGTAEWSRYVTEFGQVSLFTALHQLSQSITGSQGQNRWDALVTVNIPANTNVHYPTNLDGPLGNFAAYPSASFVSGVMIYYNGQLMRNGIDASANHDVYPGDSLAAGDIKFEFKIKKNDQISMVIVK
jgi:hypothetical protein